MPLGPGETFERYSIEALIGRGGMGEVFRAVDTRLRRKVALKVIRPDKDRPDAAARLYREARAAAALTHPNAVAVHDVGEAEGVFYIVMELVVGQPLLAFVGDPRVAVSKKVAWLTDVARAIGAAHRAGIIHRDVKPSNVMVSEEGFAKVLDFGLARPLGPIDPVSFRTQEGRVLGTLRYMAPEQVVGAEADARSDQYAFGLTAYELLAGTHPGGALIETKPKLADEIAQDVPHEIAVAIQRMLSRNPSERFASMDEVVSALETGMAAARAVPPRPIAPPSAEATATLSATNVELGIVMPPSEDSLGAAPTLAALARDGANATAQSKMHESTLVSKQAPSALVRHPDVAPASKTLPIGAQAPAPLPRTLISGPPSPLAAASAAQAHAPSTRPPPMPAASNPPPPMSAPPSLAHAHAQAHAAPSRATLIAVSVGILAAAAFAGTYLGSQRTNVVPAPVVTVTSSTASPSPSLAPSAQPSAPPSPPLASIAASTIPSTIPSTAPSAPASTTVAPAPTPVPAPPTTKPRSFNGVNTR